MPLEDRLDFQEWKKCHASIDHFNKTIVDLRKYGFTLITVLLSADGFLYAKFLKDGNPPYGAAVGVCIALMLLIVGLFRVDRFHEIFLRAAVVRAEILEEDLKMKITSTISEFSKECKTATWGTWLYVLFCTANALLAITPVIKLGKLPAFGTPVTERDWYISIVAVLGLAAVGYIIVRHWWMLYKTKDLVVKARGEAETARGTPAA